MQRAILLLALVAVANAQLFQQNYDFRGSFRFTQPAGTEGLPFVGALEYIPPPEYRHAVRLSSAYTQTIRPAAGSLVVLDPRFGAWNQAIVSAEAPYLIVAAVSEGSSYREGDVVVVASADAAAPCLGNGIVTYLNSPVPHSHITNPLLVGQSENIAAIPGARTCLISEAVVLAKLNFQASRAEAPAQALDNWRFVRRDRTIFGPTVFTH